MNLFDIKGSESDCYSAECVSSDQRAELASFFRSCSCCWEEKVHCTKHDRRGTDVAGLKKSGIPPTEEDSHSFHEEKKGANLSKR
mmetsp:Transcript_16601/g.47808  ORF Transcript_16601/g.47808 Transcript_16601/m.47808 type:complete len:85 (+) Transcript_16601:1570-1824(+)